MMGNFVNYLSTSLSQYAWIAQLTIIILIALVVTWVIKLFYKKIRPKLDSNSLIWDKALLDAVYMPMVIFVWFLASLSIVHYFADILKLASFLNNFNIIKKFFSLLLLIWVVLRYISNLEGSISVKAHKFTVLNDKTNAHALFQVLRIVTVVLSILIILQILGIPISTLLAFGGISSLAVSFAAKDTLANFIGGMMIFMDRPFSVGDWIRSPDRNIEGTVEAIGWRLTCIRTFDKRPLYVPNGAFSTISLENPSRMSNRRIKATIGVRYDDADKLPAVVEAVENMLRQHNEIDTNQTLMVNFSEFAASSLNFYIYTFTKTTDWAKFESVKQDVFFKIFDIIEKHGAACAFPTTTLDFPEKALSCNMPINPLSGKDATT